MALDNPPFRSEAEIEVEFHTAVPDHLFRSYLGSVYSIDSVAALMAATGTMDLNGRNLSDMQGIEYAMDLTKLQLYNNQIIDMSSVATLTNLATLHISVNQIVDMSAVAPLVNLTFLYLNTNQITDMSAVASLVNLTLLYLHSNQIQTSELEDGIDILYANRAALGAISCAIRLEGNPGSPAAASSKSAEIAAIIEAGCTLSI